VASPEKRCGKSTLLTVIIRVVSRPLLASNITPSAMFRAIDLWRPTLIIDEADTFITADNEDLRGIINSGHTKDTAFVIRVCGDDHEPRQFSTWAAKAIAGIGHLPGTVRDRSIEIELKRRTSHEPIEKLRLVDPEAFETIRRRCVRFAADIRFNLARHRPDIPAALHDRAADNWWPLLTIAEIAGDGWAAMAREAALTLSGSEQEAASINAELLADIKDIFDYRGVDRIATALLIDALCEDSDRPWATWNKGKPISPHQLSRRLKEFAIAPGSIRLSDGKTQKGYNLHQFNDAFCRYTPFQSGTTAQTNNDGGCTGFQKRHKDDLCRIGNPPKATPSGACAGVPFPKGENDENACEGGVKWARL
jgi:putative DNA primase/helicase